MTLSELRRRCRNSAWSSSLLALILVALAWAVRLAAGNTLQNFPFTLFFPAIAIATYMGDRRAGWVAAAASLAIVWSSYPHAASTGITASRPYFSLGIVLVIAVVVIEVTAMINRSFDSALRMAEENRVLFMELKHRTANDLQMVASLLSMHRTEATDDPSRRLIGDAIGRLRLLGDIHRRMYEPGSVSLDVRRFLTGICHDLEASLARGPITCEVRADYVLSPDAVVPLAMIVHELVSNAIEHGAGDRPNGQVSVAFDEAPTGGHVLTVRDDGPGIPDGFDPRTSKRLGMKLVRAFTAQIGGTLEWSSADGGGTLVTLLLPAPATTAGSARERAGSQPAPKPRLREML